MLAMQTILQAVAPLLAALPALEPVYIICLIVGGGLLVISTVFGGQTNGGVDVATDTGVDFGGDVNVDAAPDVDVSPDAPIDTGPAHAHGHGGGLGLSSWFSISFLIYFAAMFGLVGTVLSYMSKASSGAVLAWALVGGIVVGQLVHQALRFLRRSSGNSQVRKDDFLNQLARVTVALGPNQCGEVAVRAAGRERFVAAVTRRTDDKFAVGDTVAIVGFSGGKAEVVSKDEFEFMSGS